MGALVPVEAEYSEDLSTLCSDWLSSDITYLLLVEMANLGPNLRYENISQTFQPLLGNQNENKNRIATFISHKI